MRFVSLIAAIVLAVGACGSTGSPVRPPSGKSVWLDSVQMTSASTGWALLSTANPRQNSRLNIARTSDGGRTWKLITPRAARGALVTGQGLLHAVSNERAWVVGVTGQSSVVFGSTNGGQSWWHSSPIATADPVAVDFAGPNHGWLLASRGAAMGQEAVQVYRSTDSGRSWSVAAQSARQPGDPPSSSGLPVACDKSAVAASPAGTAWITGFCAGLADAVLVSRDDGAHWASAALPIPPTACQQGGCQAAEPAVRRPYHVPGNKRLPGSGAAAGDHGWGRQVADHDLAA